MDQSRRTRQFRARFFGAQSLGRATALGAIAFSFSLAGCRSTPKSGEIAAAPPPPPSGSSPSKIVPLNLNGENCCASFVPKSNQIVFLSRKRTSHSHFQVYIYDFGVEQDRRLSFHDGDDQGVVVHPLTKDLLYASTTDFLKEHPRFLLTALGKQPPPQPDIGRKPLWQADEYEIYRGHLDGTDLHRLTRHPGFDGEARFDPSGKEVIFTSYLQDGSTRLMRADEHGRNIRTFIGGEGHDGEAQFSPSGRKVVWVRYSPDRRTSQIWIGDRSGKNAQSVSVGSGLKLSPTWHPDGKSIIFSSNQGLDDFELFAISPDGSCLRRLTYETGQDLLPVFSGDGRKLMFTSDRSGSWQIYLMDYLPPACPGPGSDLHL